MEWEEWQKREELVAFLSREVGPFSATLAERKILKQREHVDAELSTLLAELKRER